MAKEMPKLEMQGLKYVSRSQFLETDTSYALSPPVIDEEQTPIFGVSLGTPPDLTRLGKVIGLKSEEETRCLLAHEQRLKKYHRLSPLIMLAYYFPVMIVIGTILIIATFSLMEKSDTAFFEYVLIVPFFVVLMISIMMAVLTGQRIAAAILDRSYADSLAFAACLNLTIELSLNDLLLPEERSIAIKRALGLRKFLTLLSYRYAITSSRSIDLARQHYKKMEYYIGDIERQILVSNARTQRKLMGDLFWFTKILLTSRYAEFKYTKKIRISEEKVESNPRRILQGVFRIIGAVLPLLLFLGLLLYPDRFKFLGSYGNIVALVSLAWLLLAIDTLLGVGIIDRASTLAKAIKELR